MATDAERRGWLIPPEPDEFGRGSDSRTDDIGRISARAVAESYLEDAFRETNDPDVRDSLREAYSALRHYWDLSEAVIARHEAKLETDPFRLLHRQLAGMLLQFSSLSSARPEQACSAFKARQVNALLTPLKALLQEDASPACASCLSLPLVSEQGEHTYSDVLFLLQNYQDVCADFAARHYDGQPPDLPPYTKSYHPRILQLMILDFCLDEPKSLMEIGKEICYKDRKTVRKYLAPLLASGCLQRTVPDRPNSRNQKYFTVKFRADQ